MLDPRSATAARSVAEPLTEQRGHRDDVVERPGVHRPVAVPVAARVEADGGEAERERRPGEVVVALLGRAGAVQDDDPGRSGAGGSHSE